MKKLALLLLPCILFSGCNLGCEAEKVVSTRLASAIAAAATCSGVDAIQVDVLAAIDVAKLCAAKKVRDERCAEFPDAKAPAGPIANLVCPLATAALVSVVGTKVPARYGCQLTGSPLSALALQACLTLPF